MFYTELTIVLVITKNGNRPNDRGFYVVRINEIGKMLDIVGANFIIFLLFQLLFVNFYSKCY